MAQGIHFIRHRAAGAAGLVVRMNSQPSFHTLDLCLSGRDKKRFGSASVRKVWFGALIRK
jgi:hypothetical protein